MLKAKDKEARRGNLITFAIVLALTLIGLATGLVGLIVIFPLLGHGTWHSYRAVR